MYYIFLCRYRYVEKISKKLNIVKNITLIEKLMINLSYYYHLVIK